VTVLVTGASGFIGRPLCELLASRGTAVVTTTRFQVESAERQAESLDASGPASSVIRSSSAASPSSVLCRPSSVQLDLASETPVELPSGLDTIFHLAGKAHALADTSQDESEYTRINTDGTRRLLEAAQRAGVRAFVYFSSVKAAEAAGPNWGKGQGAGGKGGAPEGPEDRRRRTDDGGLRTGGWPAENGYLRTVTGSVQSPDAQSPLSDHQSPLALDESCDGMPLDAYGKSKRAAEDLVLRGAYVPHAVVLRPSLVYGPNPKGNLEKMITAVRRGRFPPVPEFGNQRSMVHVDDVCAAAILAAEKSVAKGQCYILADDEPFSTRQLFEWICTAVGRPVPRWKMPYWTLRALARTGDAIGHLRGRRFFFDSDALEKFSGDAWYAADKAKRELGWQPQHSLRESIGEICLSVK